MLKRFAAYIVVIALLAVSCERERPVGEKEARPPSTGIEAQAISCSEVLSKVETLKGTEVTVTGEALPGLAFEFVDEQPYQLKDETGTLWVVTKGVMPEEGARITVRGTVEAPYQIKGRRFEAVIVETERKG
jgi:hypothetical protein